MITFITDIISLATCSWMYLCVYFWDCTFFSYGMLCIKMYLCVSLSFSIFDWDNLENFEKKTKNLDRFWGEKKFVNNIEFLLWKKTSSRKKISINVVLIECIWRLLSQQFKCVFVSANAISCYGKNDSHRTKRYTRVQSSNLHISKQKKEEIKFKSIFGMFIVF